MTMLIFSKLINCSTISIFIIHNMMMILIALGLYSRYQYQLLSEIVYCFQARINTISDFQIIQFLNIT